MNFSKMKNILYNSVEIANIPDRWTESLPMYLCLEGEPFDAFLYYLESDKFYVKGLIAISRRTDEVKFIEANDFMEKFGLEEKIFEKRQILDYSKYFENCTKYEKLYSEIYDFITAPEQLDSVYAKECFELFEEIVGNNLFVKLYSVIAKDYIDILRKSYK